MDEIYNDIQKAIDFAFMENKYVMNSYSYLRVKNVKRVDAQEVLRSSLINEIYMYMKELSLYLEGGQTPDVVYAREAYGYLSKPEARKIVNYLDNIVEGFRKYIKEKKGGRKKAKSATK